MIVLFSNPLIFNFTLIVINLPLNNKGSTLPKATKCFNKNTPSNLEKLCA